MDFAFDCIISILTLLMAIHFILIKRPIVLTKRRVSSAPRSITLFTINNCILQLKYLINATQVLKF